MHMLLKVASLQFVLSSPLVYLPITEALLVASKPIHSTAAMNKHHLTQFSL